MADLFSLILANIGSNQPSFASICASRNTTTSPVACRPPVYIKF